MSEDLNRHLANLGKGLVQVNLRLTKLTELVEARAPAATAPELASDVLLDLLDAVERTLEAGTTPAPAPPWWLAALGVKPPPAPDLTGLRLARDHAAAQLERSGLERVSGTGPVDPALHHVIATRATELPSLHGQIAEVHRQGWYRRADLPTVLRPAQVTAWRHTGD